MTDDRRIFSVPVHLRVDCTFFVLASDLLDARIIVTNTVDLNDYFTFDTDSLTTDGEQVLKVNDVTASPIDPKVDHIVPVPTEEYPPNTHPFFVEVPRK